MTITPHLDQLENAGLILQAQGQLDLEYLFRHALVQDAVYSTLLRQDRKRLHLAVGECLEHNYQDRLEEIAPVLAAHFNEAGDDARSLKYYTMAGDNAAKTYANAVAEGHYRSAIDIAIKSGSHHASLIPLYIKYGRVLELNSRFDDALRLYEQIGQRGRESGDRSLELLALLRRATIYSTYTERFNPGIAETLSEQALTLARETNDEASEAKALWNLLLTYSFTARYTEAMHAGEQSLTIARRLNLREQLAYTLNDMYYCTLSTGQVEYGESASREAGQMWRELGNLPMLADNLSGYSEWQFMRGRFDQARAAALEALDICRTIGNLWGQAYALMGLSLVNQELAEYSDIVRNMKESIRLGDQSGFIVASAGMRMGLALTYADLGLTDLGISAAREAISLTPDSLPTGQVWGWATLAVLYSHLSKMEEAENALAMALQGYEPGKITAPFDVFIVPLAKAELGLARKDYRRVVADLEHFEAHTRSAHLLAFAADAQYLKGKAWYQMGNLDAARDELAKALATAEKRGTDRLIWRIHALLSKVDADLGNQESARVQRDCARTMVSEIASRIDEPDIRVAFMARSEYRELFTTTN